MNLARFIRLPSSILRQIAHRPMDQCAGLTYSLRFFFLGGRAQARRAGSAPALFLGAACRLRFSCRVRGICTAIQASAGSSRCSCKARSTAACRRGACSNPRGCVNFNAQRPLQEFQQTAGHPRYRATTRRLVLSSSHGHRAIPEESNHRETNRPKAAGQSRLPRPEFSPSSAGVDGRGPRSRGSCAPTTGWKPRAAEALGDASRRLLDSVL